MWKYLPLCQSLKNKFMIENRIKGFTLLELLVALGLSSLLILCLISVLDFTNYVSAKADETDQLLLSGQYAIEYIKREIREAEKIYSIDQIKDLKYRYPDNIGFIIMRYLPNKTYDEDQDYNYCTYYFKNNRIYRIAANKTLEGLPRGSDLGGNNILIDQVVSIDQTSFDPENKTIELKFVLRDSYGEDKLFSNKLLIRCPVIY